MSNDCIPAKATHPGAILKRELQARGIKQKDFAETIDMAPSNLSALIQGKRRFTLAVAQTLERALGIPFSFWTNMQSNFDYDLQRQQPEPQRLVIDVEPSLMPYLKGLLAAINGVAIVN